MLVKHVKYFLLVLGLLFSINASADVIDSLFHEANDPVAGNKNGKVTIVEFFDYQCMHCINMAAIIESIIKNNPDVRVVFKEYPIRGEMSEVASRAALAANMQGKYFPFSHALLVADEPLSEAVIFKIAKEKGLDVAKLKKDMDSKAVKSTLAANFSLGKTLNIAGTPAFFVGNTNAKDTEAVVFVLGEMSKSELQTAIQKARG